MGKLCLVTVSKASSEVEEIVNSVKWCCVVCLPLPPCSLEMGHWMDACFLVQISDFSIGKTCLLFVAECL